MTLLKRIALDVLTLPDKELQTLAVALSTRQPIELVIKTMKDQNNPFFLQNVLNLLYLSPTTVMDLQNFVNHQLTPMANVLYEWALSRSE